MDAAFDRFLADPRKPVLLALARPVARKNLVALVRAYGESPELQARANLVLAGFGATTVVFLVRGVGLGSGGAGLLIALAQVGGVAGALLAPRLADRFGGARVMVGGNLVAALVALLIPLTATGWRLAFFAVGGFALAGGITASNVIGRGFSQTYVPDALMGRVNTSRQVVNVGLVPVGAVLGGVLAGSIGFVPTLFMLFGGLLSTALVLGAGPLRGMRDLPLRSTG